MSGPGTGVFAYHGVYRYLCELIEAAGPDQRLPPLRTLARQLRVSMSTVQSAYSLLETQGRVYSVSKSGYFSRQASVAGLAEGHDDLLVRLNALAHQPHMHLLGHACPAEDGAIDPQLQRWERHLLRLAPSLAGSPAHPCGDPQLRRALAARYSTGVEHCWNADNVYIGVDVPAVLGLLAQALGLRGQSVLVVTPCPWPLLRALRDAGVQVLELPLCSQGRIDLQRLRQLLSTGQIRLMLLDTRASLPHGTLLPMAQRRIIVGLLARHGTWLLENDSGGELCFTEAARLRDLMDPQRLLVLGSLEHGIGAQGSYGYLVSRHFTRMLHGVFLQRACRLPSIRQQAIARLLDGGQVDSHLECQRSIFQARLRELQGRLDLALGEHLEWVQPRGGMGVWVRCRQSVDGRQVFERLAQRRILVAPGELFSLQGDFARCLWLACPDFTEEQHQAVWPQVAQVLAMQSQA